MTDKIDCPECGGAGESRTGSLRLLCQFCLGASYVGGDNEPADDGPQYREDGWKTPEEGEEYDPAVHGPLPAAGSHPAVRSSGLCPTCLGAGVVTSATMVELPCPRCARLRA